MGLGDSILCHYVCARVCVHVRVCMCVCVRVCVLCVCNLGLRLASYHTT